MINKKIIKAMFSGIVSQEEIRPQLQGIYFAEDECVATDTHVMVVYRKSSPNSVGKIVLSNGEIVKGRYPDYKRVIPKKKGTLIPIDWRQLNRAVKWLSKAEGHHTQDQVVLEEIHLSVLNLRDLFAVFEAAGELGQMKGYIIDPSRPALFESTSLTAIIMPMAPMPDIIDMPREDGCYVAMSYANLINTFAIESSKPKTTVEELAWL